jgi:hypothetical protein
MPVEFKPTYPPITRGTVSRCALIVGVEDMALTIAWTQHALERLPERGLTRSAVERAVRDGHAVHGANDGDADWRIDAGPFVVLYDQPINGYVDAIRIVTAWPKRRKRQRNLKVVDNEREGYPDL